MSSAKRRTQKAATKAKQSGKRPAGRSAARSAQRAAKVRPALVVLQLGLKRGCTMGKRLCVDESMIRYCGKAISWVQYMPAKVRPPSCVLRPS